MNFERKSNENYISSKSGDFAAGREIAFGAELVWQLVKTALENGELRCLTQLNSSSNPLERCRATGSSLLTPTN